MTIPSIPTRGRTLNYAASVYDLLEPLCLLNKQAEYDLALLQALDPQPTDAILDLGCGTGLLCQKIGQLLDPDKGGYVTGIDAAGKMIEAARKKRGAPHCRFEAMAAEQLTFADTSFDAVISSLFYHHVPLDLKQRSLREAFRVLKPGGKLVIADMHKPTTFMGALVSHASRWLLMQPQIGENIRGVLPELMVEAGFLQPQTVTQYFGYITLFLNHKTTVINPFSVIRQHVGDIATLESELREGLERFWQTAATILDGSTIQLVPPNQETFSLSRNFFSTLFLYSYYRIGIPSERRILYAAVNQCLRGMVTGCDNILDDEYKTTLETDLPPQAYRFRSVLDIMVADRVLFAMLVAHCHKHRLPIELALQASATSLLALTKSGAQEASEEGGINERLEPDLILREIHHYKTGVLFQSTWAIPALFEEAMTPDALAVQDALYQIGIGCQILDDFADLFVDMRERRHNYVASMIVHRESPVLHEQLQSVLAAEQRPDRFYMAWPDFAARMKNQALANLETGLGHLFFDKHQGFVRPAALFIADRIGVSID